MGDDAGVVEFRFRPSSFLFPRLWIGLLLLAGLLSVLLDPETDALRIVIYILLVSSQLAIPIVGYVSARRHPIAVRLTPDAIEWPATKARREWRDVAAIRLRSGRGFRRWLPGLLLISIRELAYAQRADTKPSGAAIDIRHLAADRDEILAAILRYVDVPVYHD